MYKNSLPDHGPKDAVMIGRERRVLDMLLREGRFSLPSVRRGKTCFFCSAPEKYMQDALHEENHFV